MLYRNCDFVSPLRNSNWTTKSTIAIIGGFFLETYKFIATTTFGLEATVKREVTRLGFNNIKVSDGRVDFEGDISAIPKGNLWLRSADRLLLNIGEFDAFTFDELFEKNKGTSLG